MRRPLGPRSDSAAWIAQLLAALAAAVSQASVKVDPRFVYVYDQRSPQTGTGAQPIALGVNADGDGTDQAGWWLDTTDTHALALLYTSTAGASVSFPSATDLHQVPGPRWYRPWSPHVVLTGAGRSFRFGCDGRFNSDGTLQCRATGETVSSIAVSSGPVIPGTTILANAGLLTVTSIAPDCVSLIEEAALLDISSTPVLARVHNQAASLWTAAQTAIYISRDSSQVSASVNTALNFTVTKGVIPSPVALTPWSDPFDPLLLDARYTYLDSPIANGWQLQDDYVELTPAPNAPQPDADASTQFSERTRVTATLANVLKSSLVTGRTLDPNGHTIPATNPPAGVTAGQFDQLNMISAPLVHCDDLLIGAGYRERAGELRIDGLDLIDVFGIAHSWTAAAGPVPANVATTLTPRLPYWSRLKFRLQSAADPTAEADRAHPPVCGFLVPDYIDHAMDVFDATGAALGQIVSDPPQTQAGGGSLTVSFVPLPWLPLPAGADPLSLITNATLRGLIQALEAQSLAIPELASSGTVWYETGLTAMMRIIDTVRGTLDPQAKTQDRRVKHDRRAHRRLPGTRHHRIHAGDRSRRLIGRSPAADNAAHRPSHSVPHRRHHPSRRRCARHLRCRPRKVRSRQHGRREPRHPQRPFAATFLHRPANVAGHPSLHRAPTELRLARWAAGRHRGSGRRPRRVLRNVRRAAAKKDCYAAEFIQPAVAAIEPVIQAGPVVTLDGVNGLQPVMTPPRIEGTTGVFITDSSKYSVLPLPAALPLADLPTGRITLERGWVRLDPAPSASN